MANIIDEELSLYTLYEKFNNYLKLNSTDEQEITGTGSLKITKADNDFTYINGGEIITNAIKITNNSDLSSAITLSNNNYTSEYRIAEIFIKDNSSEEYTEIGSYGITTPLLKANKINGAENTEDECVIENFQKIQAVTFYEGGNNTAIPLSSKYLQLTGGTLTGDLTINDNCKIIPSAGVTIGYVEGGELQSSLDKIYSDNIYTTNIQSFAGANENDLNLQGTANLFLGLKASTAQDLFTITTLKNDVTISQTLQQPFNTSLELLNGNQLIFSNQESTPLVIRSNVQSDILINAPDTHTIHLLAGNNYITDNDDSSQGAYISLRGRYEDENGDDISSCITLCADYIISNAIIKTSTLNAQAISASTQINTQSRTIVVNGEQISGYGNIVGHGASPNIYIAHTSSPVQFKNYAKYICEDNPNNITRDIIERAINECPQGGTIEFAPGTYYFDQTITINKCITLKGAPGYKTIFIPLINDGTTNTMFKVQSSNVRFENIHFTTSENVNSLSPYIELQSAFEGWSGDSGNLQLVGLFFTPQAVSCPNSLIYAPSNTTCRYSLMQNCRFYLPNNAYQSEIAINFSLSQSSMIIDNIINSSGDSISIKTGTNNFVLGNKIGNIQIVE